MAEPNRIDLNPGLVPPLAPATPATRPEQPARTADGKTFDQILRSKVAQGVSSTPAADEAAAPERAFTTRFSAHAAARLRQRNIDLTDAQLERLDRAIDRAAAKGSKDALVMMDGTAMVVSVRNRTVITALHQDQARENVFTNIDSAVIA